MIIASGMVTKFGATLSIGAAIADKSGFANLFLSDPQAISNCGIFVGMGLGTTGLSFNIFFQWRRDRREAVEHEELIGDIREDDTI
ncbi:hypothetical protein DRQ53_08045 [bacterium]|nr:MAG: hypothetical protein DRQ53_08045 [bacterium]